jgi:epoxyqueuosine reductase
MGDARVMDAAIDPGAKIELETRIKNRAHKLGFDLAGIATLGAVESASHFDEWIAAGYAGDMAYLERGAAKRHDTRLPFEGVRSAVVVAMNYGGREPAGPVARYARGDDYHDVMVDRLRDLHGWIESEVGHPVRGKAYVDTGPILERDLARRAGIGWIGKNTNLVNPQIGSFFFLGELLLDLDLRADDPFETDRCGSCTRCLDACPTNAFVAPRVLDATKCISYQTIEQKGPIAETLREAIGEHLYGCDVCQSCCPFNVKFAQELKEPAFRPRDVLAGKDARTLAEELLAMEQAEFNAAFRKSPMKRAKLAGLQRNARVVCGHAAAWDNGDGSASTRLAHTGSESHPEPTPADIRHHSQEDRLASDLADAAPRGNREAREVVAGVAPVYRRETEQHDDDEDDDAGRDEYRDGAPSKRACAGAAHDARHRTKPPPTGLERRDHPGPIHRQMQPRDEEQPVQGEIVERAP